MHVVQNPADVSELNARVQFIRQTAHNLNEQIGRLSVLAITLVDKLRDGADREQEIPPGALQLAELLEQLLTDDDCASILRRDLDALAGALGLPETG